jgi:hypothetical protein
MAKLSIASEDPRPYLAGKGKNARYVFPEDPDYPDNTAGRLRAYLASLLADPDTEMFPDFSRTFHRGRALIERMALDVRGTDIPAMKLSPADCADILAFMSFAVPIDRAAWWQDKESISHVCGFKMVLEALQSSLRGSRRRP